jgi:hypothetical protein
MLAGGGAVDAEAEGFGQFVDARQRALQRTAWLLTDDWAADGVGAVVAAVGAASSRPNWSRHAATARPPASASRISSGRCQPP